MRLIVWILNHFFSNRRCLCCLNCFWILLLCQQASVCTFEHMFVRLPRLCLSVCLLCTRSSNISLPFIQLLLFLQGTSVSYSNPYYKCITETRSSLACSQNIIEDTPTALEVYLLALKQNETKRTNINRSSTKTDVNATRDWVISAEELGTMFKNNLRRITLDVRPIWGIYSLTLIISWIRAVAPFLRNPRRRTKNRKKWAERARVTTASVTCEGRVARACVVFFAFFPMDFWAKERLLTV